MKKVYICSSFIIFLVSSGLIFLYHQYFGLTIDAFESALNSLIVSLLIFLITVLVINYLFSLQHERINNEKEYNDYIEVLKKPHNSIVFQLKMYIITFVTKEIPVASDDKNNEQKHIIELADLKDVLDTYVTDDFFKKSIKIVDSSKFNFLDFKDIKLDNSQWLLKNNDKLLTNIHKYLMLYSKLMPNDILKLLVEIELIITREQVFKVPRNIEDIYFLKNNDVLKGQEIEELKKQLIKIINKIIEFEKVVLNYLFIFLTKIHK